MIKPLLNSIAVIGMLASTQVLASSEASFNSVINTVIDIYESELPANRRVDIMWESEKLNASVGYRNKVLNFSFHGGFYRKKNLTPDAFAIVACHEIGHVLGGFPKVYPTHKYSSEAQSDYFATNECLKKYFAVTDAPELNMSGINDSIKALCNEDRECARGLKAIKEATVIYPGSDINQQSDYISRYTIFNDYPENQCRVDTLKAGLLNMARPACWFQGFADSKHDYEWDVEYSEGQGVAEIATVTQTKYGCHIRTGFPKYWMGSYFNPLSEGDFILKGVNVVGACPYKVGETLSGSVSEFRGDLYLNLNSTDK